MKPCATCVTCWSEASRNVVLHTAHHKHWPKMCVLTKYHDDCSAVQCAVIAQLSAMHHRSNSKKQTARTLVFSKIIITSLPTADNLRVYAAVGATVKSAELNLEA